MDDDPVFAVWDDADIGYFGKAQDRFDGAMQNPIPLKFLIGCEPQSDPPP